MALKAVDKKLWDNLKGALRGRFTFRSVDSGPDDTVVFGVEDDAKNSFALSLRPQKVHVVGIDIVGYSKRSPEAQLLLTGLLFTRIEATVSLLRQVGWLTATQPRLSIPLGDGGMFIFDDEASLQGSLAFIYCLNMWVELLNRQYIHSATSTQFEKDQPYPVLPIKCRYALNTGNVMYMQDVNGADNAVGDGLVRCARILAASKGAHFLVDAAVMSEIDAQGGIDGVDHLGDPWSWNQNFHTALMADVQVKSASLRFYNVFGKYDASRLLAAQGEQNPQGGATFSIGSHDVTSIKL